MRSPRQDGWRTTYPGPQAHYRCDSFAVAARLVARIAEAAEEAGVEPEVDLRPAGVTVQLRGEPDGTDAFLVLVSRAARALGCEPAPDLVQTVSLNVAAHPSVDVRPFWSAVLGYRPAPHGAQDPLQRGPFVAFGRIGAPGRGRSHVDVAVPSDVAEARVAAALAAGGRLAGASRPPDHWTLVSPDGHGVDVVAWPDRP